MGLFNKKEKEPEPTGMIDNILASLLARYGVTQEQIDKVKTILDNVEIKTVGDNTEINIKLKNVKINISK